MKKLDEYQKSIEAYDAQCVQLLEKLDKMDPSTEEYAKVENSLKNMLEIKSIEVANMNAIKEARVPSWATSIFGTLAAIGLSAGIMFGEYRGGVIGSTASSMLNKIKFGK